MARKIVTQHVDCEHLRAKARTCLNCQVLPPFSIVLCPLHAAAEEMRTSLGELSLWMREHTSVRDTLDMLTRAHYALSAAKGE